MSWKDELQEAQGGSTIQAPKLHVDKYLQLKKKDGKPVFAKFVDGEMQTTDKPIEGVIISAFMRLTAFDDNLGTKGGTYRSTLFTKKTDKIAIFDISGRKVFGGVVEEGKQWMAQNTTAGRAKTEQVLFLVNDNGVYSIEHSITLGIDGMNLSKSYRRDYMVKLVPTLYDPNDMEISERAKEQLGKLAAKNPPVFAKFYKGREITEDIAEKWGLTDKAQTVKAMREFASQDQAKAQADDTQPEPPSDTDDSPPMPGTNEEHQANAVDTGSVQDEEEPPEDDLPF